jgi:transposase
MDTEISDEHWTLISSSFPGPKRLGRKSKHNTRDILNGILWVQKTGARWKDMPDKYPPYQTCHRFFQYWVAYGTWDKAMKILAKKLQNIQRIDLSECYIDGTFSSAKKGATKLVRPKKGKAPK